ncbi:hypothetical protein [Mucilaginibacter antarcticus]|uniref:hypothetical protein n=1 Tax=Mucilaginibacter antarcticus TaxID=1855725 RepID=UPI003625100B
MKRCLLLTLLVAATMYGCKNTVTYPNTNTPTTGTLDDVAFNEVKIEAKNNAGKITADITCVIAGDSVVAIVPDTLNDKKLVLSFTLKTAGTTVKVADAAQVSGTTVTDFTKTVLYNLTSQKGSKKTYKVIIRVFTGLPILYITTSTGADVTTRDTYINGSVVIDANNGFEQAVATIPMQIKGRGNSTWTYPKSLTRLN